MRDTVYTGLPRWWRCSVQHGAAAEIHRIRTVADRRRLSICDDQKYQRNWSHSSDAMRLLRAAFDSSRVLLEF